MTPQNSSARAIAIQRDALLGTSLVGDTSTGHFGARNPPRKAFPTAASLSTAIALSASAGYLDGFTYIGHGHVFASAMTGNMVLLGARIAAFRTDALDYLLPILAYIAGVVIAHVMMRERVRRYLPLPPHVITLLLEIAVLMGVALMPLPLPDRVLIAMITISTAMQNTSFRNISDRTYNSVFMTGNLQAFSTAFAAGVHPWTPGRLSEAGYLGSVLLGFLGGAALGASLTPRLGVHAIFGPALVLAIGVAVLLARDGRLTDEPRRSNETT